MLWLWAISFSARMVRFYEDADITVCRSYHQRGHKPLASASSKLTPLILEHTLSPACVLNTENPPRPTPFCWVWLARVFGQSPSLNLLLKFPSAEESASALLGFCPDSFYSKNPAPTPFIMHGHRDIIRQGRGGALSGNFNWPQLLVPAFVALIIGPCEK